jgi:hypothetical protein
MTAPRTIAALALAAVAAGAAGCGDNPQDKVNAAEARSVVTRFAEAEGPKACRLLTGDALVQIYGRYTQPPKKALATCVKASAKFKGEPIDITQTEVQDSKTIKLNALSNDKKFTYRISVLKVKKGWRIDQINQYRFKG